MLGTPRENEHLLDQEQYGTLQRHVVTMRCSNYFKAVSSYGLYRSQNCYMVI